MSRPSLSGRTILFDLDGTLVESAPDIVATLNRMLAARGMAPLPYAEARKLIGGGVRPLLQQGFAQAGAVWNDDGFDALFDEFIADYLPHIADETRPYPHVAQTLDRLTARGALLAVATNKRTDLTLAMMSALDLSGRFAAIVGPDLVSAKKPDAAHLIEATHMAGGDPGRAIMVGDSKYDVGAARAAGMPCVVTTFGYTEILAKDLGGDALIDSYEQLEDAIDKLVG
ncbi:MAG: HAD family hydrolase [Brevundimonas sp.]|nr:MAG: HAD family hydrolase [Brevundimonas sp.]